MHSVAQRTSNSPASATEPLRLDDGNKVAVIGGGPAGSFFSYFLREMTDRLGIDVAVDVYEPRDFSKVAPAGCNMCGGIISETLVQNLAAEGINLPDSVVQRGIDSYVMHTDVGSVRIETPAHEMRIGAVYRGSGPRDVKELKWGSFDLHLQRLSSARGTRYVNDRVTDVGWSDGRPVVVSKQNGELTYDLLVSACGVNSPALKLFEAMECGYKRPMLTKTLIREYYLGEDVIGRTLGASMHVFLLDMPRLEFAALIPKGDYVTMCLLGEEIDGGLVDEFVSRPEVAGCMPPGWNAAERSCQCQPRINVHALGKPYADRLLFIGDCGVTRLYKDGIGAAYRTAKAAARTVVFEGLSAEQIEKHFMPACRSIHRDNSIGKLMFATTGVIKKLRFTRRAMLRMAMQEQSGKGLAPRMSGVLWDLFSGSAPYGDILRRTLHPVFLARLVVNLAVSLTGKDSLPPPPAPIGAADRGGVS
jgi:flavin-dependent dehydrogenase